MSAPLQISSTSSTFGVLSCLTMFDLHLLLQEGGAAPPKPAEEEVSGEAFDTWVLPENTGRAYAGAAGRCCCSHAEISLAAWL
jgi:hypothetical protein